MTGWPAEISDFILETFGNDVRKAYGQISTVNEENQPSVRTVHIHCIEHPTQGLLISCNTKSEKWSHLKKNPQIAGCFWNPETQIQIRFEGIADLITEKNTDFADLVQSMWMKMREEVRITYLLDQDGISLHTKSPKVDPTKHSHNHGLILITPTLWDVFHNNPQSYRLGKRSIYTLKKNSWVKKDAISLHGS
jgi:pyridoxine/pyridoxamine 5'-phosphate oxidase